MGRTSFNISPAIAEALCVLRNESGMSRAEVAAKIGTSEPSIIRYETGKRVPNANTIAALSAVYGVSPADFFPSQQTIEIALKAMKGKHGDSHKKDKK